MRLQVRGILAIVAVGLAMAGCKKDPDGNGGDSDDSGDTDDGGYDSSYTSGDYRLTEFVVLELEQGKDQDGDGTFDNNLPNALETMDIVLAADFSPAGFNQRIADNIGGNTLVVLMSATLEDRILQMDVLGGTYDFEALTYGVDPASYDENGDPVSRLIGEFSSEIDYSVGPDTALIPVTFLPDEPAIPVPVVNAEFYGTLEAAGSVGFVAGVIPSDELVDDVLAKLIPDEGYDSDGDGDIEFTKEQLLNTMHTLADTETIGDIDLGDGKRGISCAFSYSASPEEF